VINDNPADSTLSVVLPVTELEVAEIVTEPRARAVANPPPTIDATLVFDEAQVTEEVMSCKLSSENVPVALNCWRVPGNKTASAGVIAIETKIALVTVRVAVEEMLPKLAEILETPVESPLAMPATPPTLMLATATFAEVQFADEVISRSVPSLKVPIAVNWAVLPDAIDVAEGEIKIETREAEVTVIDPCPVTPDNVALMVAEPIARLVAKPEPEMVTTLVLDEAQTTELVMSLLDPSL
jgi:hypothetical protein